MLSLFPHPLEEPGSSQKLIDPCIIVIFGATGDLTARKLMPALYNLSREGLLPPQFACVGFARRDKTHAQFREEMHAAVSAFSRSKPVDPSIWGRFEEHLFYHRSEFPDAKGYAELRRFLDTLDNKIGTKGNRVFYLSTQPSFFPLICENLKKEGLIYDSKKVEGKWSRVIIEKPFGYDLTSALTLQQKLRQFLEEKQIYRIDHYLGKETVQNILVFRFANSLFESLWNHHYIDHVQITVAEELGIGSRGAFFEETGLLRDIVQNHMMQLLSLVAMEPPGSLSAKAIHEEKIKVLQAIRRITPQEVVRGQYAPGFIENQAVKGYREENAVDPHSSVETFVAMRLFLDNWRWNGVPFYLRSGKRLPKRATEIAIVFKHPPNVLFQSTTQKNQQNVLAIRIQPNEGISLRINCKVPGANSPIQPVKMNFDYASYFGASAPEAYERLICDCITGDSTLFTREDEVFHSWELLEPILQDWKEHPPQDFPNYSAGSWGPKAADALLAQDQRKWRIL